MLINALQNYISLQFLMGELFLSRQIDYKNLEFTSRNLTHHFLNTCKSNNSKNLYLSRLDPDLNSKYLTLSPPFRLCLTFWHPLLSMHHIATKINHFFPTNERNTSFIIIGNLQS